MDARAIDIWLITGNKCNFRADGWILPKMVILMRFIESRKSVRVYETGLTATSGYVPCKGTSYGFQFINTHLQSRKKAS